MAGWSYALIACSYAIAAQSANEYYIKDNKGNYYRVNDNAYFVTTNKASAGAFEDKDNGIRVKHGHYTGRYLYASRLDGSIYGDSRTPVDKVDWTSGGAMYWSNVPVDIYEGHFYASNFWYTKRDYKFQKEIIQHEVAKEQCATIQRLNGYWHTQGPIVGERTHSLTYGTVFGEATSSSHEIGASLSISSTVTASAGYSQAGVDFTGETSISKEIGAEWRSYFGSEFSVSKNEEKTFQMTVSGGGHLWQWILESEDNCALRHKTFTRSYAITSTKSQKPCCLPGHCLDGPDACNYCQKNYLYLVNNTERCKEGPPPCEETPLQIPGLPEGSAAFVTTPRVAMNEQKTLECPVGYKGEIRVLCKAGAVKIQAHNCEKGTIPKATESPTGTAPGTTASPRTTEEILKLQGTTSTTLEDELATPSGTRYAKRATDLATLLVFFVLSLA